MRPLTRAAFNPAWVRSTIRSRSNSASELKIWNISFPPLVVVSMLSCKLLKKIFFLCKSFIVWIKCCNDRPRRSSFQTTKVSPSRRYEMAFSRPGLCDLTPLAMSVNISSQLRASSRTESAFILQLIDVM